MPPRYLSETSPELSESLGLSTVGDAARAGWDGVKQQTRAVPMLLHACPLMVSGSLARFFTGPLSYITDPWNVMDWLNYAIFFWTWRTLHYTFRLADARGTRACLISLELVGVSAAMTAEIKAALAERCGVEASAVRVVATHTHSAAPSAP